MEHASFWKDFFQMYKDLPALWRIKSTEYTDRVLKANCYMKLIKKLKEIHPDADREMVVRKINNFRTSYRKELKRKRECRLLGKTYTPTLWYFDYLRFLDDQDEDYVEKEKLTNELENTEVKLRFRDAAAKPQMLGKTINNAKRLPDYKDSEEEISLNTSKKRKLTHNFYKKSSRKPPSFAEQQEAKNDAEILAKSWAVQYKEMKTDQKLIARKLVSDILFYGCLGTLNTNNCMDLQELFLRESHNPTHQLHLQTQSPNESNSTFHEFINCGSVQEESAREFNSCSPPTSPTMDSIADVHDNDVKFEVA